MSGDIRSAFITLALSLPAIVLCLSIHETAHGGAAYLLGDRTARDSGRVTLSPMAHIDPIRLPAPWVAAVCDRADSAFVAAWSSSGATMAEVAATATFLRKFLRFDISIQNCISRRPRVSG